MEEELKGEVAKRIKEAEEKLNQNKQKKQTEKQKKEESKKNLGNNDKKQLFWIVGGMIVLVLVFLVS